MPAEALTITNNGNWWEQLFANAWVISFVSGILISMSGYILSRFFKAKKENEDHKQRIASANMEILNILRLYLPDRKIPKNTVIFRLINAVARKYNINSNELLSINDFFSELTKEVLNNQFMSTENKLELCDLLNKNGDEINTSMTNEYKYTSGPKNSDRTNTMATVVPILLAALGTTLAVFTSIIYKGGYSILEYEYIYFIILCITLYMVVIMAVMYKSRIDKLKRIMAQKKRMDETNTEE